jgi:glycosyltransferase involved in cell wall biosynthesis
MVSDCELQPRTILFSGHNFGFLRPFISYCQASPKYKVLIEQHASHEIVDEDACLHLLAQAEVIFCEWCLGNAAWYSRHKRPSQKLLVRLHSQELRLPFLDQVEWGNVDALIAICPLHLQATVERYPAVKEKSVLIYNPIDSEALDQPKLFGAEFNLGLLGMCPSLKAPHVALEIFEALRKRDQRFTLYVKGKRPLDYKWLWERADEREYYAKLDKLLRASPCANSIVFEPYDSEVPEWFSKIGFILSTSEREGSHQAVAEGMAAGSLPVIRNWAGAGSLYPKRFVFDKVSDAVELILRLKTTQHYRQECQAVKDYARAHFDQKKIAQEYETLISSLFQRGADLGSPAQPVGTAPTPRVGKRRARKIVALHVCYLTPGKQNGYAIRVMEETRALRQQGVEVVVACFIPESDASAEGSEDFLRYLQERTGSKCYLLPTKDFFRPSSIGAKEDALSRSLADLARRHQVDVLHGQALYSTMHALKTRRQYEAKLVFDVHGISPEEAELAGANPLRTQTMTDWERDALQKADLRVFVSGGMRQHFQRKYNLNGLSDCVVPCCVHGERFGMADHERLRKRKELGLDGKFVFLYLGTLSVWQWPQALFSVFAQFHQKQPQSLLYLILPREDHELALQYCQKHRLAAGVYLLQEVPHQDVGLIAGVADAGFLLRKRHPVNAVASPTKFGEYLAAGLPTVATDDIGDTSEIIRTEHVGLVVSPGDEGLNDTDLVRLLAFSEDVKASRPVWAFRAAQAAQQHLGWATRVQTLVDKYHELLETSACGIPALQSDTVQKREYC